MDYIKIVLSGFAALLMADVACVWPLLRQLKPTGLAALAGTFAGGLFSLKFWVVAMLLFGVFFAASRSGATLRILGFWIPTLTVFVIAFTFACLVMTTHLYLRFMR